MTIIAKKKLSEKVVDEIKKRMDNGELNVGDKLPNQNQLARELGVSRTSLREAMNTLSLLGVIEQKPGFGTAIRKKIPEINPSSIPPTLFSDSETTWELLEARVIIETGLAKYAAKNGSDAQALKLFEVVERLKRFLAKQDCKGYAGVDLEFHTLISEMAKNRFLKEAYVSIQQHLQIFMQEHTHLLPDVLSESQNHHVAICKAIADHDEITAGQEMERHILFLKKNFDKYEKDKTLSDSKA